MLNGCKFASAMQEVVGRQGMVLRFCSGGVTGGGSWFGQWVSKNSGGYYRFFFF